MKLAFHASHEQFSARRLLDCALRAEARGFTTVFSSDHLAPWSRAQGHSSHAFTWMAVVLARSSLRLGVVTTPGYRYPLLPFAQSLATIEELFPGRLLVCLGSGEALNERPVVRDWPAKPERQRRLELAAELLRRVLAGETVEVSAPFGNGPARLYPAPASAPPFFGAALTEATAARAARWADGLITVADEPGETAARVAAFRAERAEAPVALKVQCSFAGTLREARRNAVERWGPALVPHDRLLELDSPEAFEAAAAQLDPAEVAARVPAVCDARGLQELLEPFRALAPDLVSLHDVGPYQEEFIDLAASAGLLNA
ncbi:LLM class flavin-dependent oxidoreductase [Agromyces mediolanus]|uniref:LLM class flavin-dependent oxidoreductase n=1 Tax=Agromyces mediolanus TaxID=41986 RepID=UPI001E496250|nr:LLM class flavin-dependent oxidoreductase [Agromyces mediolanus]MCD1570587.1 LLM class flavin-dependent oxidoreductase [Agromyces mediolanus]